MFLYLHQFLMKSTAEKYMQGPGAADEGLPAAARSQQEIAYGRDV